MKKRTMALAMAASIFGACGCSAENGTPAAKVTAEPAKVLIAYYSWSGNTRAAAEQIQKITGGILFEIKPVKAYPADYQACVDQAKKECRSGFKPELSAKVDDMQKYDVIFVGSPNWWGTMAPPVATFLTSYDLKGKTVIPFFTHGGGGVQNCERDVRKLCNGSNLPKVGVFSGGSVRRSGDAIANWVNEVVTVKK